MHATISVGMTHGTCEAWQLTHNIASSWCILLATVYQQLAW